MSTTLSVEVNFPIGTYAFVCSGHNEVTRVKIERIGATWQNGDYRVVYGIGSNRSYKPDDLFPTADAAFAAKDADDTDEDDEDDED